MPNFYNLIRAQKFSTVSDTAIAIGSQDSATPHFSIDAGGKLNWGTLDTNLYRYAADTLKTDDSLIVDGRLDVSEIRESVSSVSISTGTLTCDYNNGCIFYIASMSGVSANFTVNITNIPTDNNYAMTISIIVNQSSTGYYPSTLQIGGNGQSIKWVNDSAPSVNANKLDVYNFTLIRISDSWVVLGSASNNYDTL